MDVVEGRVGIEYNIRGEGSIVGGQRWGRCREGE
jgi:hypothetical protein